MAGVHLLTTRGLSMPLGSGRVRGTLRREPIATGRHHEIDPLARRIHRSMQVGQIPSDAYLGFIHTPGSVGPPNLAKKPFDSEPAQNAGIQRRMVTRSTDGPRSAMISSKSRQISEFQDMAQVPAKEQSCLYYNLHPARNAAAGSFDIFVGAE